MTEKKVNCKEIKHSNESRHNYSEESFGSKYKIMSKIGEGSYSEVLKCRHRKSGTLFACKKLKHNYRNLSQVNNIPEVVTLRKLSRHPNVLQMAELHFDPSLGRVYLVFEIMEMNLYELIKDRKRLLSESRVRIMMFQLVRALRHLHKHGVFHRDVKPENILLRSKLKVNVPMQADLLKLGDLGSVRGTKSEPPFTEYISTRWYRSPECLLTTGVYSFKMDIWAAGCVFFEILTLRPLFPGSSEIDQINRIHQLLGPPSKSMLLKFSKQATNQQLSRHSSKQARRDSIQKILSDLQVQSRSIPICSKSRNFEWYFPNEISANMDKLLPGHVTSEARDLLRTMLQYDPDSRPSCHRILQHEYFSTLRYREIAREQVEKLGGTASPLIEILGDDGNDDYYDLVDKKTIGDKHALKIKKKLQDIEDRMLQTTEEYKVLEANYVPPKQVTTTSLNEKKPSPTNAINNKPPQGPRRVVDISRITSVNEKQGNELLGTNQQVTAKLNAGDAVSKSSHPEKVNNNPIAKIESENLKTTANRRLPLPPSNGDIKRKAVVANVRRLPFGNPAESKQSRISLKEEFPKNVMNQTFSPDELRKINDGRRMVQMQPIGNTNVRKSILRSDSAAFVKPVQCTIKNVSKMEENSNLALQKTVPVGSKLICAEEKKSQKFSTQSMDTARKVRVTLEEMSPNNRAYVSNKLTNILDIETATSPIIKQKYELNPKINENGEKRYLGSTIHQVKPLQPARKRARTLFFDNDQDSRLKNVISKAPDVNVSKDKHQASNKGVEENSTKPPVPVDLNDLGKHRMSALRRRDGINYDKLKSELSPISKFYVVDENAETRAGGVKQDTLGAGNKMFPRNRFGGATNQNINNGNASIVATSRNSSQKQISENNYAKKQKTVNISNTTSTFSQERQLKMGLLTLKQNKNAPTGDQFSPFGYASPRSNRSSNKNSSSQIVTAAQTVTRVGGASNLSSTIPKPQQLQQKYRDKEERVIPDSCTVMPTPLKNELENSQLSQKTQRTVYQIPIAKAANKRPEAVKFQVRDDVFCSSDDDVVATMRQKIHTIINEKARRQSEAPFGNADSEDELKCNRLRIARARQIPRRESEDWNKESIKNLGNDPNNRIYQPPYFNKEVPQRSTLFDQPVKPPIINNASKIQSLTSRLPHLQQQQQLSGNTPAFTSPQLGMGLGERKLGHSHNNGSIGAHNRHSVASNRGLPTISEIPRRR